MSRLLFLHIVMIVGCFVHPLPVIFGQTFHEDFSIWPVDLRINGTVMVCSEAAPKSSLVNLFLARGGGDNGKFVVVRFDQTAGGSEFRELLSRQDGLVEFGYEENSLSNASEAIKKAIRAARGVLLLSSEDLNRKTRRTLLDLEIELHKKVADGGVVFGVGPVASYFGKFHHAAIEEVSSFAKGLNLIPDTIVYTNYSDKSDRPSLNSAISYESQCVAVGIPSRTGMVLRGRKIRVYGDGKTTFVIAANDREPFRVKHLADTTGKRASPYDSVVDLTAWRRDAIDRQLPVFPPAKPLQPNVENGTLFIVGGGGMPKGMMNEFVELAGGKDAKMVYVPCTESETVSSNQWIIRQWQEMGVASAKVFHTKNRIKANTDNVFLEPVREATGIWFGGGRQWNFVDSYYGTKAHELMKDVLKRGGVIGGSSAGASVQGDYLARANPVANFDIMAPGYERGLGFINGVAIDQHFSQRGRQRDMTQLANRYPQLLGIGIDETTAIKVRGTVAEVLGKGKVFFYDRTKPVIPGKDDFVAVPNGHRYNLVERKIIGAKVELNTDSDQQK